MFWAFKLSFDVNIKAFGQLFQKIGQNFIHFSGHTADAFAVVKTSVRIKTSSFMSDMGADIDRTLDPLLKHLANTSVENYLHFLTLKTFFLGRK